MRSFCYAFLLLTLSCGNNDQPKGPTEGERACVYNDRIVMLHDSLRMAHGNVGAAIGTKNAGQARRSVDQLRDDITRLADSVKAMPAFDGDTSLRTAAVKLFAAYFDEAVCSYSMLPYVFVEDAIDTMRFPDSIAEPDSVDMQQANELAWNRLDRKAKDTREAEKEFNRVQKEFAKRHGFRLEVKRDD